MALLNIDSQMEKEFLIWFAGFWEGEGCISISKQKEGNGHYFTFQISQSGERGQKIVDALRIKFGGNIEKHRPDLRWKTKTLWTWRLNKHSEIIILVRKILPYLRVRKEEVESKLQEMLAIKVVSRKAHHFWVEEDRIFLKKNYLVLSDVALGNVIGTTASGVKFQRFKMQLLKAKARKCQ